MNKVARFYSRLHLWLWSWKIYQSIRLKMKQVIGLKGISTSCFIKKNHWIIIRYCTQLYRQTTGLLWRECFCSQWLTAPGCSWRVQWVKVCSSPEGSHHWIHLWSSCSMAHTPWHCELHTHTQWITAHLCFMSCFHS